MAPKPNAVGVFHNKRVHLIASSSSSKDWQEILKLSGCTFLSKGQLSQGDCDFVVSETLPSSKDYKLFSRENTVVSTEYIIQSLIHQTLLDPTGHPRFYTW